MGTIRAKAVCVLWSSGRILLLQAADPVDGRTFLIPPGGGVEFGETIEAAVRREIQEEIGVHISNPRNLGMLENIFHFAGQPEHELVFVYEEDCPHGELTRMEEVEVMESNGARFPARWYTPSAAVATGLHVYPEGLLDLLHSRSRWLSHKKGK